MTHTILAKLHTLLLEPVDTEPKVVYFLAQIRKLIDNNKSSFTAGEMLIMYCHWALHVDLDHKRTTGVFLNQLDRWLTNRVAYLNPSGPWTPLEEAQLFDDFTFFRAFRDQLAQLLSHFGLPGNLCQEDDWWNTFIHQYSGVIEDGSLMIQGGGSLVAVNNVKFEKGEALTSRHHVPFVIQWTIHLKDGRTVRTQFETLPAVPAGKFSHGIQVINNEFVPPADSQ